MEKIEARRLADVEVGEGGCEMDAEGRDECRSERAREKDEIGGNLVVGSSIVGYVMGERERDARAVAAE